MQNSDATDLEDCGKKLIYHTRNSIYEIVLLDEQKEDYNDDQVRLVERLAEVDHECISRLNKRVATGDDLLMLYKALLGIRLVSEGLLQEEAESVAESVFRKE